MLCGTIPVAVVGAKLAMAVEPVWKPGQFSELEEFLRFLWLRLMCCE